MFAHAFVVFHHKAVLATGDTSDVIRQYVELLKVSFVDCVDVGVNRSSYFRVVVISQNSDHISNRAATYSVLCDK